MAVDLGSPSLRGLHQEGLSTDSLGDGVGDTYSQTWPVWLSPPHPLPSREEQRQGVSPGCRDGAAPWGQGSSVAALPSWHTGPWNA